MKAVIQELAGHQFLLRGVAANRHRIFPIKHSSAKITLPAGNFQTRLAWRQFAISPLVPLQAGILLLIVGIQIVHDYSRERRLA